MEQNEMQEQHPEQPFLLRGLDFGKKMLKFLIPLLVLAFLYTQIHSFIRDIKPAVALHHLKSLPPLEHLKLLAVCLLAVTLMTSYDLLLLKRRAVKPPLISIWKISWIANSFNNALGFAGFTGAGMRLTLYRSRGFQGQEWLKSVIYLSLSGMTGLSVLALLQLFGAWNTGGMTHSHPWLLIAELAIASYAILFALLGKLPVLRNLLGLTGENKITSTMPLLSIGASFLEWLAAAFAFWTVLHSLHLPLTFRESTGIYAMAAVAGVISFVPGGLGSFDAVALLGLYTFGVSPDHALAALLLFRVFYYFIPWCIGLALATTEWLPGKEIRTNAQNQVLNPLLRGWLKLWNWPNQSKVLRDISNWALSALVFVGGVVLLLSAAMPGYWHRMHALEHFITPLTMKTSHQITVLIGLIMLTVSEGIRLRARRTYYFTLLLLAAGSIALLLKGFAYEEAIFLGCIFLLLWMSKDRFNREETPLSFSKTAAWAGFTLFVSLLYFSVGHLTKQPLPVTHSHAKWLSRFALKDYELRRESTLALAASWIFLTLRWLQRPNRPPAPAPTHQEWVKLQQFLANHKGNYLTHLLFLGDKSLMWSSDEQAVLAYGQIGKIVASLGDPIGEPDSIRELIGKFRDFADKYAATPVFYQVKAEHIPLYHEYGFHFFKLGEEAVLQLDQFQMSGRRRADLRAALNRFERNGYTFEVANPPFSPPFLKEMKEVSDEWLSGRQESGFSLGTFNQTYLELAPIATLRDSENRLVAFASIMPVYDNGKTISIDLMRYQKGLSGVMDALMVHLLQWAKAQGYEEFNLGMAPLGKVGEVAYSFRGERIARLLFLKGNYLYGFQGIRRFKDKFDPRWEPRYLAYPKTISFPKVVLQLRKLVAQSPKKTGEKI
ncbi:bifunctional lysylphosphatidylglycerol flippase/synthetase MprF [Gorillibacterium massiliense]|uniref:bifunctional lysylphosphatidylglycerol flippase/synthetase MprF n=1 Tax=Gorillibacterium massiliense TaxID=1280390 RepID=UPI0004B5048E|nr:bifunctional lysylphosphatidylglycerol flippase/synthetase MprF [Gorillibacterium massiliense]